VAFPLRQGRAANAVVKWSKYRVYPLCNSLGQALTASTTNCASQLVGFSKTQRHIDAMTSPSPSHVREFLIHQLAGLQHEVFVAMLLDAQNRVIDG
jgi:DNA repair protein RadC